MSVSNRIKKLFRKPRAVILMYHRIADTLTDPWQLSVNPENFESHLKVLQEYEVKPLGEIVEELKNGSLRKNCIGVSFDDGYEDNLLNAVPLLKKFQLPATFFIPSGSVGDGPFWWDVLVEILYTSKTLPSTFETVIGTEKVKFDFQHDREKSFYDFWSKLRDQSPETIKESIAGLIAWSGIKIENIDGNFPITLEQLKHMSSEKLLSIGVHTVNHPALATLPKAAQERELLDCKRYLDQHLGNHHDMVAFPYGNYNEETLKIVAQNNFKVAFTTEQKSASSLSNLYQVGRFQVVNQSGDELRSNIKKWFNQ